MAPKKQEKPAATTDEATESPAVTLYDEFLQDLGLSPPIFAAWGLGYLTSTAMLMATLLMLMPFIMRHLVAYLGGRGAWVSKPAAPVKVPGKANPVMKPSEPTKFERAYEALYLPTSVWLPPMMLIFCTSSEDTPPYTLALAMGGVYAILAGFNRALNGAPKKEKAA